MTLKKIKQSQKTFLIGLLFISVFALASTRIIIPASATTPGTLYITSGDIIKNFKLENFDGASITSGGTVIGLDERLKFEVGALWKAYPDQVKAINVQQINDKVYINYDITFFNSLGMYTNARLPDVIQTGKTADAITDTIPCGRYQHFGLFGDTQIDWTQYLYWSHLDVGDLRTWNGEHNLFSGNLDMSFDIKDSILPKTLLDYNGNPSNKSFDYVGIKTIYVDDQLTGLLSDEVPTVVGLTPSEYKFTASDVQAGALGGFAAGDSVTAKYQPNPTLSATFVSNTVDFGVLPGQSIGASLNPTQKNGTGLFDPKAEQKSISDCKFTYSIGSLSPLITEYSNTLSYTTRVYGTQDVITGPFQFGLFVVGDLTDSRSFTRTSALQVSNRYIYTTIGITFSVWSAYDIQALETGDIPVLQFPQEYYDNLIFSSIVDGFGGGMVYKEAIPSFDLFGFFGGLSNFIYLLIILAITGVVLYVVVKFVMNRRSGSGKAQSTVNILTK